MDVAICENAKKLGGDVNHFIRSLKVPIRRQTYEVLGEAWLLLYH
jgi:hypothetical protein